MIDYAEHFYPEKPNISFSIYHATYSISYGLLGTSGPSIFQSKPASSIFILPLSYLAKCSAITLDPVNNVYLIGVFNKIFSITSP
jgi:hypothetical protein